MAQVSIARIRHLIRTLAYVVTTHAADELDDEDLSVLDLENIALTGQVSETQRDRTTREVKYVIQGSTLSGEAILKVGPTGRLVVITVYLS
jgi:hypothetical protein